MDNAFRFPAASKRRPAKTAAAPVLARLPNVTIAAAQTTISQRAATHAVGYRIDPPQAELRERRTTEVSRPARTLRTELTYAPHAMRPLHPHLFDRRRSSEQESRFPRREPVGLPRSNPFLAPRPSVAEKLMTALRFTMFVALFAAIGTWVQIQTIQKQAVNEQAPPTDSAVPAAPPTTKTVDQPLQAPTAIGPVGTTPETGARVGRVRDNDDFAVLRGDILPVPLAGSDVADSRESLRGGGNPLPQARTSEIATTIAAPEPSRLPTAAPAAAAPEVARVPGFVVEIPAK